MCIFLEKNNNFITHYIRLHTHYQYNTLNNETIEQK